jgi:hypothetical protein
VGPSSPALRMTWLHQKPGKWGIGGLLFRYRRWNTLHLISNDGDLTSPLNQQIWYIIELYRRKKWTVTRRRGEARIPC